MQPLVLVHPALPAYQALNLAKRFPEFAGIGEMVRIDDFVDVLFDKNHLNWQAPQVVHRVPADEFMANVESVCIGTDMADVAAEIERLVSDPAEALLHTDWQEDNDKIRNRLWDVCATPEQIARIVVRAVAKHAPEFLRKEAEACLQYAAARTNACVCGVTTLAEAEALCKAGARVFLLACTDETGENLRLPEWDGTPDAGVWNALAEYALLKNKGEAGDEAVPELPPDVEISVLLAPVED